MNNQMTIKHTISAILLILTCGWLTGCDSMKEPESTSVAATSVTPTSVLTLSLQDQPAAIKQLLSFQLGGTQQLLVADENHGVWMINNLSTSESNTNTTADVLLPLAAEAIDVKPLNEKQALLMVLGNASGELHWFILSLKNGALQADAIPLNPASSESALSRVQVEPAVALESACLYHERTTGLLYSIALTETGLVQQHLLNINNRASSSPQLQQHFVRELAVGGELTGCAANDELQALYVAQYQHGIWALDARAESMDVRQAVDMLSPFGQLKDTIGSLSVAADHSLLTLTDSGRRIVRYNPHAIYPDNRLQEWQVNSQGQVEFFSLSHVGSSIWLAEEEGASLYRVNGQFAASPAPKAATSFASVVATVETNPVESSGDAADDPAVWVNVNDTSQSLVLGTNKRRGLAMYTLQGEIKQFLPVGNVNNVDVRYGMTLADGVVDIAAATNRSTQTIDLFTIDRNSGFVTHLPNHRITTELNDLYGLCLYQQPDTRHVYVIANDKDGQFEQWLLSADDGTISNSSSNGISNGSNNGINATRVRQFSTQSQPEGCVADDAERRLFIGEENVGLWTLPADPDNEAKLTSVDTVRSQYLQDDVEGVGIYAMPDRQGYLVVSSQGNDSYAVYDRIAPYAYRGSFRVIANAKTGIDGSSETDGLEVSSANLGGEFANGLFIAQDGRNIMPTENQNFKLVPWQSIADSLSL